ncbi:hypothetical protein VB773_01195 [Haloarculaceae archaeon H-GB2-1]|nr:hypothetical protein [Haloarculaceae archaeon H-GB1-1]MEA5388288.1 hypothetical protein [Haloarculaceae archaeon H-GB11]MEA5406330.1 hypothetical protein [Haloarculaceae archaeon H-GB2-1]
MTSDVDLADTDLTQRLVLLSVAELDDEGSTPAHAGTVIQHCSQHLDSVSGDVLGTLAEADVARALNELEAREAITCAERSETSPVGKGRPSYELGVPTAAVYSELAEDERLSVLVERSREA